MTAGCCITPQTLQTLFITVEPTYTRLHDARNREKVIHGFKDIEHSLVPHCNCIYIVNATLHRDPHIENTQYLKIA